MTVSSERDGKVLHREPLSCCRRLVFDEAKDDDKEFPERKLNDALLKRVKQVPRADSVDVHNDDRVDLGWINVQEDEELYRKCLYYNYDFFNDRPLALPPHFTDWEWEPLVDGPQFYFKSLSACKVDDSTTVPTKSKWEELVDMEERRPKNDDEPEPASVAVKDLSPSKRLSAARVGDKHIARVMKTPAKRKKKSRRGSRRRRAK